MNLLQIPDSKLIFSKCEISTIAQVLITEINNVTIEYRNDTIGTLPANRLNYMNLCLHFHLIDRHVTSAPNHVTIA